MATPVAVGDILAARLWSVLDEQAAVNTFNLVCSATSGAGCSDNDVAAFIDTNVGAFFKSLYPNTVEYRGTQVYFLKRLGLPSSAAPVSSLAGAGVGTATGPPMPRDAAGILKYNVGLRGPANRGRLYLPFISTDWQASNGRPTTAWAVFVNSFCSGMLAPLVCGTSPNQSTMLWSLIQKHVGAVPTVRGTIVNAEAADKYGNMHKRGDYGRPNSSPI